MHPLLLWADSTYGSSGSSYGNITGMGAPFLLQDLTQSLMQETAYFELP